jgi:hypothetical protein
LAGAAGETNPISCNDKRWILCAIDEKLEGMFNDNARAA